MFHLFTRFRSNENPRKQTTKDAVSSEHAAVSQDLLENPCQLCARKHSPPLDFVHKGKIATWKCAKRTLLREIADLDERQLQAERNLKGVQEQLAQEITKLTSLRSETEKLELQQAELNRSIRDKEGIHSSLFTSNRNLEEQNIARSSPRIGSRTG